MHSGKPNFYSSSSQSLRQSARFHEIDVLRGLAAFAVLLSHYVPHLHRFSDDASRIATMEFGHHAVRLFFVISGFVIFNSLDKSRTVLDFVVSRFSRLYSAYWVSILLSTVVYVWLLGNPPWLGAIVTNATMFQEFMGFPHLDPVYWSLTVELAFYVNVAALFVAGLHRRRLWIVFFWLCVTCVWALTLFEYTPGNSVRSGWLARIFALDYSSYFAMGIVFFDAHRTGWRASKLGLILFAILAQVLLFGVEGLVVASAIAAIFGLATTGFLRITVCRWTLWLGGISYSLYLLHRNLGFAALNWLLPYVHSSVVAFVIVTAAMLLLATMLTRFVEIPAMRAIRAVYRRWKAA